jgi:hypothetical protein
VNTAEGTFEVSVVREPDSLTVTRSAIGKRFSGDLEGSSVGAILSFESGDGFATHVAMEAVRGRLDGMLGTFVLQHEGHMNPVGNSLAITIVAGSGGGDPEGILGEMVIERTALVHTYTLRYKVATAT